jgi:hypothetical protein
LASDFPPSLIETFEYTFLLQNTDTVNQGAQFVPMKINSIVLFEYSDAEKFKYEASYCALMGFITHSTA